MCVSYNIFIFADKTRLEKTKNHNYIIMSRYMKHIWTICLFLYGWTAGAQEVRDSVRVHFRQGYSTFSPAQYNNQSTLDSMLSRMWQYTSDSSLRLSHISIIGGASPEGSIPLNRRLSQRRAKSLRSYLQERLLLPDSLIHSSFVGRDWNGLIKSAATTDSLPYQEETLALLRQIAADTVSGDRKDPLNSLISLHGGIPYRYMYRHLFPELRAVKLLFHYEPTQTVVHDTICQTDTVYIRDTIYIATRQETVPASDAAARRPYYLAIKTNMLYDLLLVPNIGVEVYLGKNWSAGGNWMYAWWKTDRKQRYWRTYGGDLYLRRWLGSKAKAKPLTGHHLGLYGGIVTYDFELGGRGYLGDKWSYHAGIEYGYAHPIARRLNLEFNIGIGYLGGEYKEYLPIDNHYVWQATKRRHWFGPTKAEISLVWLIGRGNINQGKGGKK